MNSSTIEISDPMALLNLKIYDMKRILKNPLDKNYTCSIEFTKSQLKGFLMNLENIERSLTKQLR